MPQTLTTDDLAAIRSLFTDDFQNLHSKVDDVKQDVAGLKSDVVVLKQDVTNLKEDITDLKEDVTSLKLDVAGLKDDVTVLKQDVSILRQDIAGLKDEVGALKQDVGLLRKDVTDLQQGLDALARDTAAGFLEVHAKIDMVAAEVVSVKVGLADVTHVVRRIQRVQAAEISRVDQQELAFKRLRKVVKF